MVDVAVWLLFCGNSIYLLHHANTNGMKKDLAWFCFTRNCIIGYTKVEQQVVKNGGLKWITNRFR